MKLRSPAALAALSEALSGEVIQKVRSLLVRESAKAAANGAVPIAAAVIFGKEPWEEVYRTVFDVVQENNC